MASDQSKSVKLYSFAIGLCDKFDREFRDSGTHSASFCCFIRAEVEVGCCAAPSSIKTQIWQIIVIGPADSRLIRVIRSAPGLLRKLGRPWNLRNHHMEIWLLVYTFAFLMVYRLPSHIERRLQICQLFLLQNRHCLSQLCPPSLPSDSLPNEGCLLAAAASTAPLRRFMQSLTGGFKFSRTI